MGDALPHLCIFLIFINLQKQKLHCDGIGISSQCNLKWMLMKFRFYGHEKRF